MSLCHRRGKCITITIGIVIFLLMWVSLCAGESRWSRQDEKNLWIYPEASFRFGEIHGYLQTPDGGALGSTSHHRPTFSEMGIQYAAMGDALLTAGLRNHALYAGARVIYLSGSNVLDTTLVSRFTTFPAGTRVKGEVHLNWYRFGYQHRFLFRSDRGTTFGLHPAVGLTVMDYKYSLDGVGGLYANRSYIKLAPHIGLDGEWRPKGRFSVSGGVWGALPIYDMPFILSAEIVGKFRLWGNEGSRGLVFLGIGYDRVEYVCEQVIPNHIKADIGPQVITGLEIYF